MRTRTKNRKKPASVTGRLTYGVRRRRVGKKGSWVNSYCNTTRQFLPLAKDQWRQ